MQAYKQRWSTAYKVSLVLIAGFLTLETTKAYAQSVFLTGAGLVSDTQDRWPTRQAGFQFGGRYRLSDKFQVQGAFTYILEVDEVRGSFNRKETDFLSVEASLTYHYMHPFTGLSRLDPYVIAGLGAFIDGDESQLVMPLGTGVEYRLNENLGLLLELTGRWSFVSERDFAFMAAIGVSYKLNRLARRRVQETAPPVEEEAGVVPLMVQDKMVLIPDGTFILGLADEDPLQLQTAGLRRITLSQFYIDQYEVSNADYLRFIAEALPERRSAFLPDTTMEQVASNRFSGSEYLRGSVFADHPVVGVTYDQAQTYCAFYGKRLPTEAKWEYAARAGQIGDIYPWPGLETREEDGNFLANYNPGRGGYAADGYAFTAPVDAYPPSRWNLHSMSGNVAEWCQDTFHPSYTTLTDFNPLHSDPNEPRHIVRGGSWASDAFYIGVGVRGAQPADKASPYVGFRCVMDVTETNDKQQ